MRALGLSFLPFLLFGAPRVRFGPGQGHLGCSHGSTEHLPEGGRGQNMDIFVHIPGAKMPSLAVLRVIFGPLGGRGYLWCSHGLSLSLSLPLSLSIFLSLFLSPSALDWQ